MHSLLPCLCAMVLITSAAHAVETPDEPPFVYVSSYETGSWQGHVKAYPVTADGVSKVVQWDAADLIPAWQARRIGATSGNANLIAFEWQQLDDAQRAALSSAEVLEYVRGNHTLEAKYGIGRFRDRKGKLGDIMYSAPLYVGRSDSAYQFLPAGAGGEAYQDYVKGKKQRPAMLYAGANDGMLHAFDALNGIEASAFVPQAVFSSLPELSEAAYVHRPYVDGLLTAGDAYLDITGGASWKTILLGATGGGARSLIALDVSDPALATPVLWQRSADDDGKGTSDGDMGYLHGEAFAVRLANGAWAAVYGNGYQSDNLDAALYLVELAGGGLIRKITVGAGDAESPNGLATPALVFSRQRVLNAVYAGDLQGRLWKVDLGADQPQRWQSAFGSAALFIAADNAGKLQSIVQQPLLEPHARGGALALFSGGKPGDGRIPGAAQKQSLYGIWDKPGGGPVSGREQLQRQTLAEGSDGQWQLSSNSVNWELSRGWYIDLPAKLGYVVGKLQIIEGVLWLLTYAPAQDKSYLIALDYNSGGASDNAFGADLKNTAVVEVPGSTVTPIFIKLPDGRKQLVIAGRDGLPHAVEITPPRQAPVRTWRQLPVPASLADPG